MITLRLYGRSQPTLAVVMIHHNLQQVGNKTLSTRRYSARLTHQKPEIK
jgi:hypothetical protein